MTSQDITTSTKKHKSGKVTIALVVASAASLLAAKLYLLWFWPW